ncbi:MAG: 50S ribosomal protein L32e [Methanoregula sp.]|nr:50S ribosomal protein L32e [Methanoregula sp.]
MTTEIKRLIRVRVAKGAVFKRDGYGKKRQLSDSWRKPRGQHNKQREQKKAKGALPKPGYGSPIAVRGMHPSGFFEVLVATATELEGLDPKTQAVRISGTVGDRKRIGLQAAAIAAGLKVLNARTVKSASEKAIPAAKKSATPKKETSKPAKPKATDAPAKKGAKKTSDASPEAKKAPGKEAKKAANVKAEKASEEKAVKAPAKAVKKPAKPAAEKSAEPAPSKPKATKKTGSGVKKNE